MKKLLIDRITERLDAHGRSESDSNTFHGEASTFDSIDSAIIVREESKGSFIVEFLNSHTNTLYKTTNSVDAREKYLFLKEKINNYLNSSPNVSSQGVLDEFGKPSVDGYELQRA